MNPKKTAVLLTALLAAALTPPAALCPIEAQQKAADEPITSAQTATPAVQTTAVPDPSPAPEKTPPAVIAYGDYTLDGLVDTADAQALLAAYAAHAAGLPPAPDQDARTPAMPLYKSGVFGDVDQDGTLTTADAQAVLRYAAARGAGAELDWNEAAGCTVTEIVLDRRIQEKIDTMSLHEKVCQLFVVEPETLAAAGDYAHYPVGGMIYLAKHLKSPAQTTQMIAAVQTAAREANGIGALICVDEEGGTVARCAQKLDTTQLSPMAEYGKNPGHKTAVQIGRTLAWDISGFGFNVDLAPVADVNINPDNELGSRIFSSDPAVVAEMTAGVVEGLHDYNVCATLKHFPGLGAAGANTHDERTVTIRRSYAQLADCEFIPFAAGIEAGADFVMVGHAVSTAAGDGLPGDLSPVVVTDWLRGDLCFRAAAITDAHGMNTISEVYTPAEAAVLAIEAGMDIILEPVRLSDAIEGVEQAVTGGRLQEARIDESLRRILTIKQQYALLG